MHRLSMIVLTLLQRKDRPESILTDFATVEIGYVLDFEIVDFRLLEFSNVQKRNQLSKSGSMKSTMY